MDSSLQKKIWFIETGPSNEEDIETISIIGGGLCIDPSGLILTVAHVVTLPNLTQEDCLIRARGYDDGGLDYRIVELIDTFPHFDLALFKVSKEEDEVFDFVPIGEGVQVRIDELVFGYVHQNRLLYTGRLGSTCYPFPENVVLPDITEKTTMESSGFLRHNPTFLEDKPYRTVASITEESDVAFHDLHPNLPLVQVSGFGTEAGTSGCPLFKYGSGEVVGLFSLQKHCYQFVIPVNFLRKFVDHVREVHNC